MIGWMILAVLWVFVGWAFGVALGADIVLPKPLFWAHCMLGPVWPAAVIVRAWIRKED